ncbi:MAG: hypothetical protein LQ340_007396, partial [Diploschistes diacapsis]
MQESIVQSHINLLIERLDSFAQQRSDSESTPTVDLTEWINYADYDIISELGWGTSFNYLETKSFHPWTMVATQYKALLYGVVIKNYPTLASLVSLSTPKSAIAGLQLIRPTNEKNSATRLSIQSNRDFMHHVFEYNKSYSRLALTEDEIAANSTILIINGSDPLATTLQGALNHLLKDSERYEKLTREIRQSFAAEHDINTASVKKLIYLTAILQETIRLCPPASDPRRRLISEKNTVIADHQLPVNVT